MKAKISIVSQVVRLLFFRTVRDAPPGYGMHIPSHLDTRAKASDSRKEVPDWRTIGLTAGAVVTVAGWAIISYLEN